MSLSCRTQDSGFCLEVQTCPRASESLPALRESKDAHSHLRNPIFLPFHWGELITQPQLDAKDTGKTSSVRQLHFYSIEEDEK